jgi:hypothetical protein
VVKNLYAANWKTVKKATGMRLAIYNETEINTLYIGNVTIMGRGK